jgi:hypothetical protein
VIRRRSIDPERPVGRAGRRAVPAVLLILVSCTLGSGGSAPDPITYWIEEGDPASGYRETDRTLAEWALRAWVGQEDPALELVESSEEDAVLRVRWVRANEGLYGEARVRDVEGRTVADVYVRPDLAGLGADIEEAGRLDPLFRDTIVYLTCVHEIGHAFGLEHTAAFADIMYSFQYGGDFVAYFRRFRDRLGGWDDIRTADPFSDADRAAFRARAQVGGPRDAP